MKKLLFTALAVVVFSGVTMANNVEAKKLETKVIKENVVLKATPCQDMMIDIYEYTMNTYNNGGDDISLLNALLSNCK